jgi:hypothetical protein
MSIYKQEPSEEDEKQLTVMLTEFKEYYLATMLKAYKNRNPDPSKWDEETKQIAQVVKQEFNRLVLQHLPTEYLARIFTEQFLPEFVKRGKMVLATKCLEQEYNTLMDNLNN